MRKLRILTIFGTRPEAIKMAPLVLELRTRPEIDCQICITAQHREMLDSVMDCFGLKADYDLDIMEPNQTLQTVTTKVLNAMSAVLETAHPDLVLVHGDTTTTFAGALAAFYAKIPVGHVEAGLRTFDPYSPFPEEMNRRLVGQLSSYHFAPTFSNQFNLTREGIDKGVFITGNTVIDAMRYTIGDGHFCDPLLQSLNFETRRVIVMTCHRRENYGQPMEQIFTAVHRLARDFPDTDIVYPVHPSPVVRECANRFLGNLPNVYLIEPLDAIEMHRLLHACYMVMTDSGGLQEEAPALGKPVLVLRRETERPEAIHAGTVRLAGVETDTIYQMVSQLLTDPNSYDAMAKAVNPYGDGQACPRIADAILFSFGYDTPAPEEFA